MVCVAWPPFLFVEHVLRTSTTKPTHSQHKATKATAYDCFRLEFVENLTQYKPYLEPVDRQSHYKLPNSPCDLGASIRP